MHFYCIDGSVEVPDLHDSDIPSPDAFGALGLAAASVSNFYLPGEMFLITDRWSGPSR